MHLSAIELNSAAYPTREFYPFSLPIFHNSPAIDFTSPLTFFVGENGSGKTTLLEAISRRASIHIWRYTEGARFAPNQYEKALAQFLRLTWSDGEVPGAFFSSQSHRDFSLLLDEWATSDAAQLDYFGGKSLVTQSHGQSVMSLFRGLYKRRGLYFSDEPETALSPARQLELARLLVETAEKGHAQFIIATHSPILLACPGAEIISFDGPTMRKIAYEETEHYRVYKRFMEDPAGSLSL